ncbi:MAG: D-tagatose-bisphosphate aldolase, class II, non-catalytic subunit [Acidobacteria bacterium]|nr:D-tagatose-bisphosphate aldolase, class II, non-catalytic subunit [Acidobacteriota bacterium]
MLLDILKNRKVPGSPKGIYSVCTAHPFAIRAAMRQAKSDSSPLLIEATSNQVNQFGGYTGMRPADFRRLVEGLAATEKFPIDHLILGGDHLGPNPWQHEPADRAMVFAEELIAEYAKAGFNKLHLDASMPCSDDPADLAAEVVAARSARLCAAAEKASDKKESLYVIGTEVPPPGGAKEAMESMHVTRVNDAEETLQLHRQAFRERGLDGALERVIAIVVQPGVEFNHDSVYEYRSEDSQALQGWLEQHPPLVFEAHSTDYQRPQAYRELVNDGFAILKVGPAVTFAMREALFALAEIEHQIIDQASQSQLMETVERVMVSSPANWKGHYHGGPEVQRLHRMFSYSDRIRYYWNEPEVRESVNRLLVNLRMHNIPETLLSAYMREQYHPLREGLVANDPLELMLHATQQALRPYAEACFPI